MPGAEDTGRALFSGIAGGYDTLNRVMTLGLDVWWRRRALRTLERCIGDGQCARVLDLASDTADFAIAAARFWALRRWPRANIGTGMVLAMFF